MHSEFVNRYGSVYERSPWIAERVARVLGDDQVDTDTLAQLMVAAVDNATTEEQLALIRAHPDLAGKAQVAGELTEDSSEEQTRAGLDQCSTEEFEQFQLLNTAYKEKFGFPFVMAVRNSSRQQILAAFTERLKNDYEAEFDMALRQIHEIARLRLDALGHNG